MATVFYTVHAQKTMAERGVTREEVEAVIARPEVTYRGNSDRPDCKVLQAGDLGVVILPERDGLLVITVLWRRPEEWKSEEMRDGR